MPDNQNPELRIKLVADDLSAAVVKAVREGMQGVRDETERAREAAGPAGFMGEMLKAQGIIEAVKGSAELVGEAVHLAYESMEQLADAAVEAAEAQERQQRAMAGALFLMDGGKHDMEDLREYAADTREEFADLGIQAGVATSKITEAYDAIVARGTVGSERAKELAEQMAVVGKVVPGGMDALAQGFSMVELGMVRARNPIVQLIAATHTLKGNAHEVAAAMQKMTPEQQMKAAEEAITRQAKALGPAGEALGPVTLEELRASGENIKEAFLEAVGNPVANALAGRLTELRDFLVAHMSEIEAAGEEIGEDMAQVVEYLSEAISGIHDGFVQDWDQIKGIAEDMKAAWGVVFNQSTSTRTQFRILADDLVILFKGVLHAAEMAADVLKGNTVGTTEAQVQGKEAAAAAANATDSDGATSAMLAVDKQIQKYRELALAAGMNAEQVDDYAARIRAAAEQNLQTTEQVRNAVEHQDYAFFGKYVDSALAAQSEGAEKFAIGLLEKSEDARRALLAGGLNLSGGIDALMKVIEEKSPQLYSQLQAMQGHGAGAIKAAGGVMPPAHIGSFIGNATFNIKQDFRDQDPNRIIATFRNDLRKAAQSRLQARVSSPFGV